MTNTHTHTQRERERERGRERETNLTNYSPTLFQIWCAAAVNMTGGRTKDGGDIVGASVFYHDPPPDDETCGNKSSGPKNPDDAVFL